MFNWKRGLLFVVSLLLLLSGFAALAQEKIEINAQAPTTPFPHFWENFGSGRAILSLRQSYRSDLKAVKQAAGFHYVRFHGIFDDEMGVYTETREGKPVYNFAYVDQVYDGLLKHGVRPIVEISFMPKKLAFNPDALHAFWYKPNVSPPWSYQRWDDLVTKFAQHLVNRYGIDEVSKWYFEVWNEPNIDFWDTGNRLQSYFALYDHTARDLKSVSPRLRVGGPATAHASWIPVFLKHVSENHIPIDFVSTHGYADDTDKNLGIAEGTPMDDRVCDAVKLVQKQIDASPLPHLPLLWTEWNVQGKDQSRDTIFVGPAVANTIRQCDGHVKLMSFWTFSDVFEEGGVIPKPFVGGFGLRAKGGINKPSFYGFQLLHELGDRRIANPAKDVIVTKTMNGGLAIAAWNLVDPGEQGSSQTVELDFQGVAPDAQVTLQRVDSDHGNVLKEYAAMGSPLDPTPEQVKKLNQETALPPPSDRRLSGGKLDLKLSPDALVLIKLSSR